MKNRLSEIHTTRQIKGEPRRRWFSSDDLDLIVWFGDNESVTGFQLCYDKLNSERAVTWLAEGQRFSHNAIDDGESAGLRHKASPVLVPDGTLDAGRLLAKFLAEAEAVPPDINEAVVRQLQQRICPEGKPGHQK